MNLVLNKCKRQQLTFSKGSSLNSWQTECLTSRIAAIFFSNCVVYLIAGDFNSRQASKHLEGFKVEKVYSRFVKVFCIRTMQGNSESTRNNSREPSTRLRICKVHKRMLIKLIKFMTTIKLYRKKFFAISTPRIFYFRWHLYIFSLLCSFCYSSLDFQSCLVMEGSIWGVFGMNYRV